MIFKSRLERQAAQCVRYAEACAWWASLQERQPGTCDPFFWSWIECVGVAYTLVTRLARATGLPDLAAKDGP